jgi:hypothetical protein
MTKTSIMALYFHLQSAWPKHQLERCTFTCSQHGQDINGRGVHSPAVSMAKTSIRGVLSPVVSMAKTSIRGVLSSAVSMAKTSIREVCFHLQSAWPKHQFFLPLFLQLKLIGLCVLKRKPPDQIHHPTCVLSWAPDCLSMSLSCTAMQCKVML